MSFRKGDYVVPTDTIFYRVTEDTRDKGPEDAEGIVINATDKRFIKVFSLKTKRISDFSVIYFEKSEVPKEYLKEYLMYIRDDLIIRGSDHIENIVVQKECYGEQVYANPIMDELRKNNCLCLNCELMTGVRETNCDIANQLYKIAVENNMAMAITRCKKYSPKSAVTTEEIIIDRRTFCPEEYQIDESLSKKLCPHYIDSGNI